MEWKALGVLTTLGAFIGCSAAPDAEPEPQDTEPVGVVQSAAAGCTSYVGTIQSQINSGRAFERDGMFYVFVFPAFYATGSSEYLGASATQNVTLYPKQGGGYTTNASLCQVATCGNGVLEAPPEDCDGSASGTGSPLECAQFGTANGSYVSGMVKCTADCKYDFSDCKSPKCGNGILEGNEECDGTVFGTFQTCQDDTRDGLFSGGQLKCKSDCTYDVSSCVTTCGNGVLDSGEDCDGTLRSAAFTGKTCTDFLEPYPTWPFAIQVPYSPGTLSCNQYCRISPPSTCALPPGCYYVPIAGSQPSGGLVCH